MYQEHVATYEFGSLGNRTDADRVWLKRMVLPFPRRIVSAYAMRNYAPPPVGSVDDADRTQAAGFFLYGAGAKVRA